MVNLIKSVHFINNIYLLLSKYFLESCKPLISNVFKNNLESPTLKTQTCFDNKTFYCHFKTSSQLCLFPLSIF